jgi:hypothetical protein
MNNGWIRLDAYCDLFAITSFPYSSALKHLDVHRPSRIRFFFEAPKIGFRPIDVILVANVQKRHPMPWLRYVKGRCFGGGKARHAWFGL